MAGKSRFLGDFGESGEVPAGPRVGRVGGVTVDILDVSLSLSVPNLHFTRRDGTAALAGYGASRHGAAIPNRRGCLAVSEAGEFAERARKRLRGIAACR